MEIQKGNGVVLSSISSGEADKIARIYTRDYGKRNFIFKGIKKSRKRSAVASEIGTIINLLYYYHANKEYHTVNEFKIQHHYFHIRENLSKILHLYLILESVEKTTGYNDPNKSIYDLLASGIDTLSKTIYDANLTVIFLLSLLRIHGILPDMKVCKSCGRSDFTDFHLDYSDLMPICGKCAGNKIKQGRGFNESIKGFISHALKEKFASIDHAGYKVDDINSLLFIICLFIENYFHIEINSKMMLFQNIP